jgi:ABC-type uncharacterized transport system auxiliary subunit
MVYMPNSYRRDVYYYDRWRVNPADMITDHLIQDLRNSGLFRAVFSAFSVENSDYLLEGNIEKFLEVDERENSKAELAVNVTLIGVTQKEKNRIVFQQNYALSGPLEARTAAGFAASMSKAVELFSEQLIKDIHHAVKGSAPAK